MAQHKTLSHIRTPDPVADDLQKNLSAGEKLYNTFCGTCHQRDGGGAPGRFPPLSGTDWVTGDKTRLIDLVLNGKQGPM